MSKKIDFKSVRKLSWPFNVVVFNFTRLIPFRNKKIWVFGAWEGKKYDDNSRVFFEYVKDNYQDKIRCIWLTRSKDVLKDVNNLGGEVYMVNSLKGMFYSIRAGVSIYTNGLIDFGIFPLVGGSKIVALWHGVAYKKIYNDAWSGKKLKVKKFLDKFFSWVYRDVTISTSEKVSENFTTAFNLKKGIFITGQPRNDVFKGHIDKESIMQRLNINKDKRLILYLPTYRGKALGENAMSDIVKNLYNNKQLSEVLKKTNSVFVVKLHPLTPHINLNDRDDFIILDYKNVENNQKLLSIADILVSDYSSCSIDYALLNRPIIFYLPDKDEFARVSEPLYDEFYDLCKLNHCSSPDQLADMIATPSNKVCDAINDMYESLSIKGTCYSENVYDTIIKQIGL